MSVRGTMGREKYADTQGPSFRSNGTFGVIILSMGVSLVVREHRAPLRSAENWFTGRPFVRSARRHFPAYTP